MKTWIRNAALPAVVLAAAVIALRAPAVDGAAQKQPDLPSAAPAGDQYNGLCVPLNATDMLAPEASFRVGNWNSNWGQLKIMELAKDGQPVKKGDVVARYEFIGKDALRFVTERIQEAEAARATAKISAEQTVEALMVDQRRLVLEARLAAVDIQKAPLVSKKQQALYDIKYKIAQFEADAVRQRVGSAINSRDAELAYQDQNVARAMQDKARYSFYEKRFSAYAPHDGVVRHAFNSRERRKNQKGDNIGPGQKLAAIAKDETLAAKFFVPEHRIHELREGSVVMVASGSSGEEMRAVVKKIEFFPQELGFLMELPTAPNAREKAFAVFAEFEAPPAGLTAGTELKVKPLPGVAAAAPASPKTATVGAP